MKHWQRAGLGVSGLAALIAAGFAVAQQSEPEPFDPETAAETYRPFEEVIIESAPQPAPEQLSGASSARLSGGLSGGSSFDNFDIGDPGGGGDTYSSDATIATEYLERQNVDERLAVHGIGLMGDQIDLNTGSLSFEHVDVSIPGNSGLEVAIRRKRSQGFPFPHLDSATVMTHDPAISPKFSKDFGDWDLDLPYISYTMPAGITQSPNSPPTFPDFNDFPGGFCEAARFGVAVFNFWAPTWANTNISLNDAIPYNDYDIASGIKLSVPGGGMQTVLDGPEGISWPAGTSKTTKDYWSIDCGSLGGGAEGFEATAPDGTVYTFDKFVWKPEVAIPVQRSVASNNGFASSIQRSALGRTKATWLATQVTDVHGNWVKYEYNAVGHLQRIHANDLREITINRNSNGLISSVSAHGRTWTYAYAPQSGNDYLDQVTLPDGRNWDFNLVSMIVEARSEYDCVSPNFSASLTHPDGMTGTFSFREFRHRKGYQGPSAGRTGACGPTLNTENLNWYKVYGVKTKTLSGPGYPSASWTYDYSGGEATVNDQNFQLPAGTTKWSQVTDPVGTRNRTTYHANGDLEGLTLKTEVFDTNLPGDPIVQTMDYTYQVEAPLGTSWLLNENPAKLTSQRHTTQTVTTVDGVSYTTSSSFNTNMANANYSYGNPVSVTTSSPLVSQARVVNTTYEHNTSKWILGRPNTVTRNGVLFDDFDYDGFGRLIKHKRFDEPDFGTFTWHTSGDQAGRLNTYTDAIGRTITLSNYKRGTAQAVTRPDLVTLNRIVDDNGWLTSQTTARNNTYSYSYDNAGRLTQVDYPGTLSSMNVSYSGLGSGIVQTNTMGTLQTRIEYDAMYRPTLVRQRPLSGGGGDIYTRTEFDALNRATFTSFPSTSSAETAGSDTFYDALGRTIRTRETVAPFAETTTDYLTNGQMRVTDPEGNITTTTRNGYGSPDDGNVTSIAQPEGVTTTLSYNVYGYPLTATQDGITQSWTYDNRYRVCAHTVPETGTKRFDYDDANQLIAYAEGLSGGCGSLPSGDKVTNTYDVLGRITNIDYPTGTADTAMSYDLDGNVLTNSRGSAVWTYTYDANDRLSSETLAIDSKTYGANYTFDTNGYLTAFATPGGRTLNYYYDGHGRQIRVREVGVSPNAAQAGSYFPNGQMKQLVYGNGFTYRTTQTARQQTLRAFIRHDATSTFATDFTYAYDANGLITSITDGVVSGESRTFGYDGLNRLIDATGPWGDVDYTYDANNNLLSKVFTDGGTVRTVNMLYNGSNRLYRYSDTDTTGGANKNISYDARGNVVHNSRQFFVYDHANQPVSANNNGVSATFEYDGNYKRVKQTVNGETIYTVYGQSGAILLRDNVTTGEVTDYIRLGGMTVAELKNGVREYLMPDHLGTPIVGTDASRNILWRDSRTPFGEKMAAISSRADRVGYTGHIEDTDLKLTYMQARYYDPVLGRFMSNDPVGFLEGGPGYHNRYSYVENQPTMGVDPAGEACANCVTAGIGGVIGGLIGGIGETVNQLTDGKDGFSFAKVGVSTVQGAGTGAAIGFGCIACGAAFAGTVGAAEGFVEAKQSGNNAVVGAVAQGTVDTVSTFAGGKVGQVVAGSLIRQTAAETLVTAATAETTQVFTDASVDTFETFSDIMSALENIRDDKQNQMEEILEEF